MFNYFYLDNIYTLILVLLSFVIVTYANFFINKTYNKYKNKQTNNTMMGIEIANTILSANQINYIKIIKASVDLGDHYNPLTKEVALSNNIYSGNTIASYAVAAHEIGHVIQEKEGYVFLKIRRLLVPIVNLVNHLSYLGLILGFLGTIKILIMISLIALMATIIFQLITLPVEFDASKRALQELIRLNLVTSEEQYHVKKMLDAAAFTYVASTASSIMNFIRLYILLSDKND